VQSRRRTRPCALNLLRAHGSRYALRGGRVQVEQISWNPRAWVVHNLLTEKECDHLVDIASNRLHRSGVVDVETGKPLESNIRTRFRPNKAPTLPTPRQCKGRRWKAAVPPFVPALQFPTVYD
jgi:hypothetical protein